MSQIIELLYDQLPSANNTDLLWKMQDKNMYNQYTQFVDINSDCIIQEMPTIQSIENDILCIPENISVQHVEEHKKMNNTIKTRKTSKKCDIIKPLDLILRETNTTSLYIVHIKDKLIEFISKNEFIKVFGSKKSAEIMSAIVNNRWNKSLVLFISFLFDKTVRYGQDDIVYNKEANSGIITLDIGAYIKALM